MPGQTPSPLRAATAALALTAAVGTPSPARAAEGIERVSVGPGGAQGNDGSARPALSADGRFVAFYSGATNLVPGDTNGQSDVFVRDLGARTTTRVSVGPGGAQADGDSSDPSISADGRHVAFYSDATNLVPGDTNGTYDVFVHDRETGRNERVSVGSRGAQADGYSFSPALSADGRYVAFLSDAANLVPGDTNRRLDVFVRDRRTGRTTRASVGPGGKQANHVSYDPALSADGRFVAFWSAATNLVPGDTNAQRDVFVHDLRTRRTTRVSVGPVGVEADGDSIDPTISADGRHMAFLSSAANLVPGDTNDAYDVFVHDLGTRATARVNVGPGGAQAGGGSGGYYPSAGVPALSADGRTVAFYSDATNLVPGDTNGEPDVFVHNRRTGVTRRPTLGPGGVQADGYSFSPALSADGRVVAFESVATNLVPGDTNGVTDVFVRTRR